MSSSCASVVLFDIPASVKEVCRSPNIWRTRFLLIYKKIAHTTRWVEYPDIKPLFLELGIPSSGKNAHGEDAYTCPAIQYFPADESPPVFLADSWKIADFLEERHPNPPVFPDGAINEQRDRGAKLQTALLHPLMEPFVRMSYPVLNEPSKPYFRQARERLFGKQIEELRPDKKAIDSALATAKDQLDEFMKDFTDNSGPYFDGKDITYLDMVIASIFMGMKVVADEDLWL